MKIAEIFWHDSMIHQVIEDADKKHRIWYPDFYLNEYGIYLEFYGVKDSDNYNFTKQRKNEVYERMGLQVLSIEPENLYSDFESYIINELYGIQKKRYNTIQSKVYKLKHQNKSFYK